MNQIIQRQLEEFSPGLNRVDNGADIDREKDVVEERITSAIVERSLPSLNDPLQLIANAGVRKYK